MKRSALAVLVAFVTSGCGSQSPTQPASRALQTIAVTGVPSGFAVDERAQLIAQAAYSDDSSGVVTATVRWSTRTLACVVDATGLLRAISAGACTVEAALDGVTGSASVTIGAAKLFTISGVVREEFGISQPRMPGVPVVITTGSQAGRRVLTDATGRFLFVDVPREQVGVRADAAGYDPEAAIAAPGAADLELLIAPPVETIGRRFTSAEILADGFRGLDTILTVTHRGPARLFASTTGRECHTAHDGFFAVLLEENGAQLAASPCEAGSTDRTVMLEPGRYRFIVQVQDFPPGYVREYRLTYPK